MVLAGLISCLTYSNVIYNLTEKTYTSRKIYIMVVQPAARQVVLRCTRPQHKLYIHQKLHNNLDFWMYHLS